LQKVCELEQRQTQSDNGCGEGGTAFENQTMADLNPFLLVYFLAVEAGNSQLQVNYAAAAPPPPPCLSLAPKEH